MMNKEERNNKIKKIAKKGLTISLCAALAAGAFQSGSSFMNLRNGVEVEAASDDVELIKTKSSKKSEDSDKQETTAKGSLDVSDIVEETMPSVVAITTKSIQEVQNYFGMFGSYSYAPQIQEVQGGGSGIIIGKNSSELLIVTNYHVVEDANTLSVSFVDNEVYEAKVKGFDEDKDVAVVSIPLDEINDETMDAIKIATIGSSDDLKVGNQVVVIGNALGYGQSVTTGIVSAKNRRLDGSSEDEDKNGVNLIQTDAAINPGNSGGALLNMDGEVVGINSAKLASTEVEGMCYAIAISDVTDIIENLMNEKTRDKLDDDEHGVLQITGKSVSEEAQYYGIPAGAFVEEVTKNGAADDAGIKHGDIITAFNGKTVSSIEKLISYLAYYAPDEEVELTIAVQSGEGYKEKTVTVVLGEQTAASDEEDNDKKSEEEERATLNRRRSDDEEEFEDGEENPDDSFDESDSILDFFSRG